MPGEFNAKRRVTSKEWEQRFDRLRKVFNDLPIWSQLDDADEIPTKSGGPYEGALVWLDRLVDHAYAAFRPVSGTFAKEIQKSVTGEKLVEYQVVAEFQLRFLTVRYGKLMGGLTASPTLEQVQADWDRDPFSWMHMTQPLHSRNDDSSD